MDKILPYILATITQHPREKVVRGVNFEWSKKSWVHNIMRAYEFVFWRRAGIRCESTVTLTETGKTIYQFHTLEAAFSHIEGLIRNAFSIKWVPVKIYIPQLATVQGFRAPSPTPYLFAIAFDTSDQTTFGAPPRTVSVTTSGSDRLMILHTSSLTDPGDDRPTYNAVASTLIAKGSFPGAGRTGSVLNYLIAPATGANTASFPSSGANLIGQASSYTGCKQTDQPDSNATTSGTSTTITGTTTVVATGCWLVVGSSDSQGAGYANGTGTIRQSSGNGAALFDSNGTVGTGSQSKTITVTNASWEAIAVSIAPAATPSSIKTVNGLAIASVKTVNGLARASVKSWNGLE